MKNAILLLGVLVGSTIVATAVQADYITPTGVTLAGDIVSTTEVSKLISDASNASYVQSNPGADSLGDLWEATTVSDRNAATNPAHAILTFDLGAMYDVTTLYAWRYVRSGNDATNNDYPYMHRSVNNFSLLGSTDGTAFNQIAYFNGDDRLTYSADATESVQTRVLANLSGVNVDNAKGVRYLRMDITSAWNGWLGDSSSHVIGLGEVAFEGTAIPEPASIVMLLTGLLGLLAYAWRKRR